MPRYYYVCDTCGTETDVDCKISELDSLHVFCPTCTEQQEMRRPPVCPNVRNAITWEVYSNKEKGMIKDLNEANKLRKTADRAGSKISKEDKKGMKDEARKLEGKKSNGKYKGDL